MTSRFAILRGNKSSLAVEIPNGEVPIWRHWGAAVRSDSELMPHAWRDTVPVPSFSLDKNQPVRLLPLFGRGWLGPSALLANRSGFDWAHDAERCETSVNENRVVTTVTDEQSGLVLAISLELDAETDVVTLETKLTNSGSGLLDVSWLASGALLLPPTSEVVESFSGRHNHEFQPTVDRLSRSSWRRENRRGLTSHDCPPLATVLGEGGTDWTGPTWSASLAWSGNTVQTIDWLDDGTRLWMAGMWLSPGEVRLEPGESLQAPEWLATFSPDGRNGAAQNLQAAIRKRGPLGEKPSPRPVHINTWEGFYFDHDEAALKSLADAAAELGIERFVLDDGWFKGRGDDTSALGDWTADLNKYPQGLGPLAEHVTARGMEFGLWVEPEMVNPDSDLYRANPEWTLNIEGKPRLTSRHQFVLDMTKQEVRDYLFDAIDRLLSELPITYLKWDHNRDLTEAGSDGRPAYRNQVLGTYALIDRLRAAHPKVEIESCAGGGGRIDAGILTRTHRVWTSDCIDAVSRLPMQRGFLGYFPPEIMGAHVGTSPAHSTGRRQSMSYRAAVALAGHFGVELDVRKLDSQDRQSLQRWIAFYKEHRDLLHSGRVWRGDAGDGVLWQAHGKADEFLLLVYRTAPTGQRFPPGIQLPFLSRDAGFSVRRIDPETGRKDAPLPKLWDEVENGGVTLDGSWLSEIGLPLPYLKAERAMVLSIKQNA